MSCTCNTWQRWLLTAVLVALSVLFIGAGVACDDNNDGSDLTSGTIRSVRNIAGTNVVGLDTLVDAGSNSIVVAALQYGAADYGRGTVGAAGEVVLVLTRYDAALQPLWQTVVDGGFSTGAPHIAFDPSGNIALTITGFDSVDVGHGAISAPLVSVFSIADGSARWSSSLTRDPAPDPRFVVCDPGTGDVFVVSNASQVVIDRLSAGSGAAVQQARQIAQPAGSMAVDSVAVDGDGNLFVAGTFDGQIRFQEAQYTAVAGQAWGYVAKIGKDGLTALWSRPLRLRDASQHVVISTLGTGDVGIAGQFAFADDTSDTANPLGPLAYVRLARLSGASGATTWTTRNELPNTATLTFADLADFTNDIYLTMTFNGTLALAGSTAVSTTTSAMAILHASGDDGTPAWLRYSTTSATVAGRVGIDGDGNPMTLGSFTASAGDGSPIQSIYILEVVD